MAEVIEARLLEDVPSSTPPSTPPVTVETPIAQPASSLIDLLAGMGRSAGQGLSLGLTDEAVGLVSSMLDPEGLSMRKTYRDAEREKQKQFVGEHPILGLGSEILGTIPTSLLAGAGLASFATRQLPKLGGLSGLSQLRNRLASAKEAIARGGRMLRYGSGVGLSGLLGLPLGYAYGEGETAPEILSDMQRGGLAAALGYGLLSPAILAGRVIGGPILEFGKSVLGQARSAGHRADEIIRNRLGDKTPEDLVATMRAIGEDATTQDPYSINYEFPGLAQLGQTIAQSGPAQRASMEFFEQRSGLPSQQRLIKDYFRAVNVEDFKDLNTLEMQKQIRERMRGLGPEYEDVLNNVTVELSANISQILATKEGKRALQVAKDAVETDRKIPWEEHFELGDKLEGGGYEIKLTKRPTLRTLDEVKRALDEMIEPEYTQASGFSQLSPKGRRLVNLKADLVDELDTQYPEYKRVRGQYADVQSEKTALQKGEKAWGTVTLEEINEVMSSMSPAELEFFKVGSMRALLGKAMRKMGEAKEGQMPWRPNHLEEEKMRSIYGEEAGQKLIDGIVRELGYKDAANRILHQSRTHGFRQESERLAAESSIGGAASQLTQQGTTGKLKSAVDILNPFWRRGAEIVDPELEELLVRRLFGRVGDVGSELLKIPPPRRPALDLGPGSESYMRERSLGLLAPAPSAALYTPEHSREQIKRLIF